MSRLSGSCLTLTIPEMQRLHKLLDSQPYYRAEAMDVELKTLISDAIYRAQRREAGPKRPRQRKELT